MTVTTPIGEPPELKRYSGLQRASALMLALGKDHGAPIWEQLSTEEIKELSSCISQLGRVLAISCVGAISLPSIAMGRIAGNCHF